MRFSKPKKELGRFLKDKKNTFSKSKLIRISLTMGTAIIGMNFILPEAGCVTSAHSNIDSAAVSFVPVGFGSTCVKLVPTHTLHNQHANHINHANHSSY